MAYDKKLHFGAGVLIAVVVGAVLHKPEFGLVAALVAGVLKECWDWHSYGDFDEKDTFATWLGGLVGCIVTMLLKS